MLNNIQYIKNNEIDFVRWDNCISNAVNGNLFSYSWYLKATCLNWDALVLGDYIAVLPLPYYIKWGQKIIANPSLVTYTGIQSTQLYTPQLTFQFINAIPLSFAAIKIVLNNMNIVESFEKNVQQINYYNIDLISSYTHHARNYTSIVHQTFSQLEVKKLTIISGLQAFDLVNLYLKNQKLATFKLNNNQVNALRIIASLTIKNGTGEIIGIYDHQNNLCACALFVGANQKSHLLFYAQNAEARQHKLVYMLIDFFIKKHSEKNSTLCLHESQQNNKIYDFKNLGAGLFHLPVLSINKLPWYFNVGNWA